MKYIKKSAWKIYIYVYLRNEMKEIRGSSYIKATLGSFVLFQTKLSFFFCILSYVLLGNNISAKNVIEIS